MKIGQYWEPFDFDEITAAKTFAELAPVAIRVLQKMPQPVSMVSGPVTSGGTGSVAENVRVFERAIVVLEKRGEMVFSTLPFKERIMALALNWRQEEYCTPALDDFYLPILKSGFVAKVWFIPSWRSSVGSVWIHETCEHLGIERLFLSEEMLQY